MRFASVRLVTSSILGLALIAPALSAAAKVTKTPPAPVSCAALAAPDGRAAISPFANALLATAGTGDVLAGTIAGLVAQGLEPFEAAACGVYVHALAAEELGEEYGDRGMLASELLPALPRAMRTIREGKRQPPMNLGGLFGGVGAEPPAMAGGNPFG